MLYFNRFLLWPLLLGTKFVALFLLSWHFLAQVHFAYPVGYELLGLERHIAEYAPLNRHKAGFEHTTSEDHWRLFAEITDAIQHHGQGLNKIFYQLPNRQQVQLMHEAELIHLQDVANLVDRFYQVGISCGVLCLALLALAYWKQLPLPSVKKIALGFLGVIAVIAVVIIAIGAKDVFYWLHVKIFPDDHQWFFYYQDSLMTTLMKAPDIFAFIAVLILGLWIFLWCGSLWLTARILARSQTTQMNKITEIKITNTKKSRKNNRH